MERKEMEEDFMFPRSEKVNSMHPISCPFSHELREVRYDARTDLVLIKYKIPVLSFFHQLPYEERRRVLQQMATYLSFEFGREFGYDGEGHSFGASSYYGYGGDTELFFFPRGTPAREDPGFETIDFFAFEYKPDRDPFDETTDD